MTNEPNKCGVCGRDDPHRCLSDSRGRCCASCYQLDDKVCTIMDRDLAAAQSKVVMLERGVLAMGAIADELRGDLAAARRVIEHLRDLYPNDVEAIEEKIYGRA